MAFIPVPDTVSIFMEHTGPDEVVMGNLIHATTNGTVPSPTNMSQLAGRIVAWWDADMQPLKTAGYALTRLLLRDLTDQNSYVIDYTTGLPLTGSLAGNSLPSNVAWSIKLGTGKAGRSYRGRLYHFGMSEEVVSGNFMDATHAGLVLDAYEALKDAINFTDDYDWTIVSRTLNGTPLISGIATPVTSISAVDLVIDTQRRRLPD